MIRIARQFAVDTLDGADGGAVFHDDVGHLLVLEAEGLDARVVAAVEPAVHDHADSQSRTEGVSDEVLVFLGTAELFEPGVHLGQCAAQRLAVGEQVAVVVDEDRNAELRLEEGPEGDAFAERREVREVAADDAVGVVGRAGECETDGHGLGFQPVDDLTESLHHRGEAFIQVLGVRGERDGVHDEFVGLHGAEHQIRSAGIEGDDHPVVVAVHIDSQFFG